ncbi:MAG: hypothetical protein SGPRY_014718 [Prymnesium sp.]
MAEREEEARRQVEKLEQLVEEKEEEAECVRGLKAQMVKRKREAEAKAGSATALEKELKESRKRCRALRADVNSMLVKMSLRYQEESDAESGRRRAMPMAAAVAAQGDRRTVMLRRTTDWQSSA